MVHPGDIPVIILPEGTTPEMAHAYTKSLESIFGKRRFVVVARDVSVDVIPQGTEKVVFSVPWLTAEVQAQMHTYLDPIFGKGRVAIIHGDVDVSTEPQEPSS